MKSDSYVLCLIVFFLPLGCYADGLFFWSVDPFGNGAQPGEILPHFGNGSDSLGPSDIYLYYQPGSQDISDSFSLDLKFEHYEVLDAEVFNFPITVGGIMVGSRWDDFGEITIDEDSLVGFSGFNSSSIGGLLVSNTGLGRFSTKVMTNLRELFLSVR